jgi:hypothetical protein
MPAAPSNPTDFSRIRQCIPLSDRGAWTMNERASHPMTAEGYEQLLTANLVRVFGERDRARRQAAIAELYAPDAVLYEPDTVATGHDAIDAAVEALLTHLPPAFVFTARGPVVGHHGVARLSWAAGPVNGPVVVTGTDVAHVMAGRIQSLYVLLDPAGK